MNNPQIFKILQAASAAAPAAAKLKKATQDIEAIFIKDLLSAMRRTAPKQSLGGSSLGADMYQDLFDQAISEAGSRNGTLGVGATIYRQMAPLAIRTAIANASRSAGVLPGRSEGPSPTDDFKHLQDGRTRGEQDARITNEKP